ncbi:hypothetical protein Esi_0036_0041 [Ectocarpus siliculosus]|uniref:Uncharacterized protein n=1 Tax=Ectocarpus siliculosus TaxID=2880 RepID=D8LLA5_ECTSI|nr:hypothetical protein Esi_0036_0041 [Ectocarpus siliculosus]|eukprot:CBN77103.1 hypothetical protein Esi_0036_0041 [Ectocarpus siliculosus]
MDPEAGGPAGSPRPVRGRPRFRRRGGAGGHCGRRPAAAGGCGLVGLGELVGGIRGSGSASEADEVADEVVLAVAMAAKAALEVTDREDPPGGGAAALAHQGAGYLGQVAEGGEAEAERPSAEEARVERLQQELQVAKQAAIEAK